MRQLHRVHSDFHYATEDADHTPFYAAGNVSTCNNWKPDFDNDIGATHSRTKPAIPGGMGC